jgi:hypothetical protein
MLAEKPKPTQLEARGGCWFESGAVTVHLGVDKNFVAAGKAHPAFIVDGLANMVTKLKQAGYRVTEVSRCRAATGGMCTIRSATE